MAEEQDPGNAVAQRGGLGAGPCRVARSESGGGTWGEARRRSDVGEVCVVLRVLRSSRRSPSRLALSSRGGGPWGEVEWHMRCILNPNCVGGPGRGGGGEVAGEVDSYSGRAELKRRGRG